MLINVLTRASSARIMSEDAFQSFSLLLELPDTCQELVVQTLYHDFHYLPELPHELRLHIWRCIFPNPRDVRLCYRDESLSSTAISIFPPITSRINKESREETWLHYHLLWPQKAGTSAFVSTLKGILFLFLSSRLAESFTILDS
jgi:hypothetical protein